MTKTNEVERLLDEVINDEKTVLSIMQASNYLKISRQRVSRKARKLPVVGSKSNCYNVVNVIKRDIGDAAVYCIAGPHGTKKIGWSRDPIDRFIDIQSFCPVRLALVFCYFTETPKRARTFETIIHSKLEAFCSHGEWVTTDLMTIFDTFAAVVGENIARPIASKVIRKRKTKLPEECLFTQQEIEWLSEFDDKNFNGINNL